MDSVPPMSFTAIRYRRRSGAGSHGDRLWQHPGACPDCRAPLEIARGSPPPTGGVGALWYCPNCTELAAPITTT
ncbi:MAG: hypothetical protein AB7U18_04435, partial [Dehalococcoidia bacterium]